MADRPILFSAPMIRALLAGTKTQTRRVVKPQPADYPAMTPQARAGAKLVFVAHSDRPTYAFATGDVRCPYGQPGDRLRVKEAAWMWCERQPNGKTKTGREKWLYVPMRAAGIWYAADHRTKPNLSVVSPDTGNEWGWRLKIGRFLPAWASRITLEVLSVRVERLQDISEEDALAEGVHDERSMILGPRGEEITGPIAEYAVLWESINGPGSWDANPWVWCVEFRRLANEERTSK